MKSSLSARGRDEKQGASSSDSDDSKENESEEGSTEVGEGGWRRRRDGQRKLDGEAEGGAIGGFTSDSIGEPSLMGELGSDLGEPGLVGDLLGESSLPERWAYGDHKSTKRDSVVGGP